MRPPGLEIGRPAGSGRLAGGQEVRPGRHDGGGRGIITGGCNRKEDHAKIPKMREIIDQCAAAGVPNVIAFSGNRRGLSDQEGMENCVDR